MRKAMMFFVMFMVAVSLSADAKPSKKEKFDHADKNDDGKVDRKEKQMEEGWQRRHRAIKDVTAQERHMWMRKNAKVNNAVEKKYDIDQDGWLGKDEAKALLKDKKLFIKKNGKNKVDSPIEAEYDTNNDGFLDMNEISAIDESV